MIFLSQIGVDFGGTPVLTDVSVTISVRQRWGLVGRNGTGKTTLLNVIMGTQEPTRGTLSRPAGLRLSLLDQHREHAGAGTVWEAAASPFAELIALEQSLHALMAEMSRHGEAVPAELLARYDRELERFQHADGYALEARVDAVLHGLGFDPARARVTPLTQLSGGELGRVGLAAQLVAPADVLLLDEPTNHLDLETTRWLESYLRDTEQTVLVISHDRAFLEAIADHILHFEAGTAVPYVGGFTAFVQQHEERRVSRERAYTQQQRQIAAEVDYIRRNIAGQNSRQAKGRRTRLERLPRLTPPVAEDDSSMSLRLEPAERGGNQVLVATDACADVPGRTLLRDFTARVERGEVVGLIGANGSGKSTLLRAITGERELAGGRIGIGASVDVAYYRQDLTQVPPDKTLFSIIHDLRPLWHRGHVQSHLARFGFSGDTVQKRAAVLSGGETARVALAMLMLSHANLLLLDEPTNHLDVESIEALEDSLADFDGTVILVSHDRALLRALATRVWHLHDARIDDFEGSFGEWEEHEAGRVAEAAAAARRAAEQLAESRTRRTTGSAEKEKEERVRQRRLRAAAAEAEQAVLGLEAELAELEAALADGSLYGDAEGVRRAQVLTAQRVVVQERLTEALGAWEQAAEALE